MSRRLSRRLVVAFLAAGGLVVLTVPNAVSATPPGPPTDVRVTARGVTVDVRWAPPLSDGGSPITGYTVTAAPGGATVTTDGQTYSATFTSLEGSTAYTFTAAATTASGTSIPSVPTDRVTPLPKAGTFQSTAPVRALDTRNGIGSSGPLNPGEFRSVHLPITPSAVSAVVNVTSVSPTASGYLTLYAAGTAQPLASSLNFAPGATVANLVNVPVSPAGDIVVYNAFGQTQVVIDLLGFHIPSSNPGFTAVTPTRVYDSRQLLNPPLVWPGGKIAVTIPDVPPETPVYLNVTVTNATGTSYLTAYDCSGPTPATSNLNVTAGQTASNAVVVKTTYTRLACFAMPNIRGDLIVDLNGVTGGAASYAPQDPTRVLDTRNGTGAPVGRLGPGQTVAVSFPTYEALSTAVTMNLTGTNASQLSYLTVYPCGIPRPAVSNVNIGPGRTAVNQVNVGIGSGHQVCIYNDAGYTDVVADLSGYHLMYSG